MGVYVSPQCTSNHHVPNPPVYPNVHTMHLKPCGSGFRNLKLVVSGVSVGVHGGGFVV